MYHLDHLPDPPASPVAAYRNESLRRQSSVPDSHSMAKPKAVKELKANLRPWCHGEINKVTIRR